MLILRAIPLSFAILLPRILLVPFFVIAYALAGLAISVFSALLMIVSPVIGYIAAFLLALAMMSFPMMIGIRLGFNQRQHNVTGGYGGLIVPAMIYGFIEGAGVVLITILGSVIVIGLSPDMSLADLGDTMTVADGSAAERALEAGDASAIVIFLLGLLAISALRAALLVPLAGAAAGRDANGQFHTPLVGFGVGLLPLTALVILSYIALPLIVLASVTVVSFFGPIDGLSSVAQPDLRSLGWSDFLLLACIWVGWIWIFCLQCAGGVLCYLRQRDGYIAQKAQAPAAARMDAVDARALWKSRMK